MHIQLRIIAFILLVISLTFSTLTAQTITITGAGSDVNGTYNYFADYGGKNEYKRTTDWTMIMWRPECGNIWTIIDGPGYVYYSNTNNTTLPPDTGWTTSPGTCGGVPGVGPVPTLAGDVMPVELASMTATTMNGRVTILWKTATETDNFGFDVERRAIFNGGSRYTAFVKVGFIPGAGTSTSAREYSFTDTPPLPNPEFPITRFVYRLKQVDLDGTVTYSHEAEIEVGVVAKEFRLGEAYPNPFNPTTSVEFSLATPGMASLKVYNVLGQEVATLFNAAADAGRLYRATWDASSMPSGIYFVRLESGNLAGMKRLMLVK